MNAFPLPSLAREGGALAVALGALLLLGVAFAGTVFSTLAAGTGGGMAGAAIATPRPAGVSAPRPIPVASPVVPGDTRWGSGTNTYCEAYVEWRTGIGNQGPTAFAAYLHLASEGLVHGGPPPVGALVYFGPSSDNAFDGHVGIYDGAGLFTSVTAYGVQQEAMAGWRAPYLGWVDPAAVPASGR